MSKREWIDKAFEEVSENEFELYKQKESKLKPCEKINWWIETPKKIPYLKVGDILPYLGNSQQIEFIAGNPFAFMSAGEARRDAIVQNMKVVNMWVEQWHLCLEVER